MSFLNLTQYSPRQLPVGLEVIQLDELTLFLSLADCDFTQPIIENFQLTVTASIHTIAVENESEDN